MTEKISRLTRYCDPAFVAQRLYLFYILVRLSYFQFLLRFIVYSVFSPSGLVCVKLTWINVERQTFFIDK